MKRIIKFRAWDKEFKVMRLAEEIKSNSIYSLEFNTHWEVMQFTGLLDSKGKEIYERDIVKGISDNEEEIFQVSWIEERNYCGWNIGTNDDACEILGNVFENPELLNETKTQKD